MEEFNLDPSSILFEIPQAFIVYDSKGKIVFWNRSASTLYRCEGRPHGQQLESIVRFVKTVDSKLHRRSCFSQGRIWEGKAMACLYDKTNFPVLITEVPKFNENNELALILSMSKSETVLDEAREKLKRFKRDAFEKRIVQSKELDRIHEELVKENKERIRVQRELALVSMVALKTDTGVIITDKHRFTIWVNKAFTDITGYSLRDMYGHNPGHVLQCSQTDKRAVESIAEALDSSRSICVDLINKTKSGELVTINLDIFPVFDDEGNLHHYVSLQRLISNVDCETVRGEAVRLAHAEAYANKMKTEFIMNMSHELRTPLNGILGMASALLHSPIEKQEDLRQGLEVVLMSSKMLLSLINNIVNLSKIESGKLALDEINCDLSSIITDTVSSCKSLADHKNIELHISIAKDVPLNIICDMLKVRQVLINLVGNAIKFSRNDSDIYITVSNSAVSNSAPQKQSREEYEAREVIVFKVKDSGPGIHDDEVLNIFGRFVQLEQSVEMTGRYGGSGLGLHISKQYLALMQGEIWVDETEIGQGSTFAFSVPVLPSSGQSTLQGQADKKTHDLTNKLEIMKQRLPSLEILVVEDNKINQRVVLRLLKRFEHNADVANDGQEALDMMGKKQYDLVFMDVQMPVMDGLTASRKIHQYWPDTRPRIAALTANVMQQEMAACIQAGMDYYISKPITMKKLFNFYLSVFDQDGHWKTVRDNSMFRPPGSSEKRTKFTPQVLSIAADELADITTEAE